LYREDSMSSMPVYTQLAQRKTEAPFIEEEWNIVKKAKIKPTILALKRMEIRLGEWSRDALHFFAKSKEDFLEELQKQYEPDELLKDWTVYLLPAGIFDEGVLESNELDPILLRWKKGKGDIVMPGDDIAVLRLPMYTVTGILGQTCEVPVRHGWIEEPGILQGIAKVRGAKLVGDDWLYSLRPLEVIPEHLTPPERLNYFFGHESLKVELGVTTMLWTYDTTTNRFLRHLRNVKRKDSSLLNEDGKEVKEIYLNDSLKKSSTLVIGKQTYKVENKTYTADAETSPHLNDCFKRLGPWDKQDLPPPDDEVGDFTKFLEEHRAEIQALRDKASEITKAKALPVAPDPNAERVSRVIKEERNNRLNRLSDRERQAFLERYGSFLTKKVRE